MATQSRQVLILLYSVFVRLHLDLCAWFWSPQCGKDVEMLDRLQQRATKMVGGLRGGTEEAGLAQSGKEEPTENPKSNQLLKGERKT